MKQATEGGSATKGAITTVYLIFISPRTYVNSRPRWLPLCTIYKYTGSDQEFCKATSVAIPTARLTNIQNQIYRTSLPNTIIGWCWKPSHRARSMATASTAKSRFKGIPPAEFRSSTSKLFSGRSSFDSSASYRRRRGSRLDTTVCWVRGECMRCMCSISEIIWLIVADHLSECKDTKFKPAYASRPYHSLSLLLRWHYTATMPGDKTHCFDATPSPWSHQCMS